MFICSKVPPCVEKAPPVEEPVFTDDIIGPTEPARIGTPVCAESVYSTELPKPEHVQATRQAELSPTKAIPQDKCKSLESKDPKTKKGKKGKKTSSVFTCSDFLPGPQILPTHSSDPGLDEPKLSESDVPSEECVKISLNDSRVGNTFPSSPQAVDLGLRQEEEEPIPLTFEAPPSFEYERFPLKDKKKGKKTKKSLVETLAENPSPLDDGWDSCGALSKKPEDRKKDQMTPASPMIEACLPPTDDGDLWDICPKKPKSRKKGKADLPSPKMESTFIPKDDWNLWGKSMPEEGWKDETMDPPPPEIGIASPLEDGWGSSVSKKKVAKGNKKKA